MDLMWFFVYFGFVINNTNLENIGFSENIEYCTNIIHNPDLEEEFLKNCNLKETNKYIMLVKNNFN